MATQDNIVIKPIGVVRNDIKEPLKHGWRKVISELILAYNLGNFLRRMGLPKAVKYWSLHSLQVKLIKIGGRIVRHTRRIVFQLAEVAVPRDLFVAILERISRLRLSPG